MATVEAQFELLDAFPVAGKEVGRYAHTTSKATAQQFLAHLLDEHRRLDRGGNPRRTYREALERFIYDYLPTLKPGRAKQYRLRPTRSCNPSAAWRPLPRRDHLRCGHTKLESRRDRVNHHLAAKTHPVRQHQRRMRSYVSSDLSCVDSASRALYVGVFEVDCASV